MQFWQAALLRGYDVTVPGRSGAARGRRMTSWSSIRTDLRNAGAEVVDEAALVDRNMVTSRCPQDIPVFNREMVALFANGAQTSRQSAA
ncbi:MAG TPA: DJ-1/PfpI family protein [Gemmatimonadales bacterium]|nr:DJ-1/PfpI family protein [Gemmatimonadales bacterium]